MQNENNSITNGHVKNAEDLIDYAEKKGIKIDNAEKFRDFYKNFDSGDGTTSIRFSMKKNDFSGGECGFIELRKTKENIQKPLSYSRLKIIETYGYYIIKGF